MRNTLRSCQCIEEGSAETQLETDRPQHLPPSYSEASSRTISRDDEVGDDEVPRVWRYSLEDPRFNWKLIMSYGPTTDGKFDTNPAWDAQITFYVKDLPKFMRKGFFWSQKDCIRRLGHCYAREWPAVFKRQWPASCHYTLIDKTSLKWHAKVLVLARECFGALSDFRLEQLGLDTVRQSETYNPEGKLVYRWCRDGPRSCNINVLYGDMPMDGLWPWPKARKEDEPGQAIEQEVEPSKEPGNAEEEPAGAETTERFNHPFFSGDFRYIPGKNECSIL